MKRIYTYHHVGGSIDLVVEQKSIQEYKILYPDLLRYHVKLLLKPHSNDPTIVGSTIHLSLYNNDQCIEEKLDEFSIHADKENIKWAFGKIGDTMYRMYQKINTFNEVKTEFNKYYYQSLKPNKEK